MINSTIESKKLRIHPLYLKQAEAKTRELTIWVNWIKPFFSTLMDKTPPLFKTKDDILPRIINQLDNHTHDTPAKILRRQLRNDRHQANSEDGGLKSFTSQTPDANSWW
ncbi:hypothetical protein HRI_003779600 [Hibiscus trionum]|uniref:Uncharacterized protein n=1 Tax=Hibiscus trionum TaxID=183268 RepID=A0A9W7MGL0_HIBTR|nr:hypothetical protein HRI_003779600 [Hibiscus trionum]